MSIRPLAQQSEKYSVIVFLLILITGVFIQFNLKKWDSARIIIWDVMGYYLYLPAVFIYDDLAELRFSESVSNAYRPTGDFTRYGIVEHAHNGRATTKYPIGVALLNVPVFLTGHVAAKFSEGSHPADGYSIPYQKALAIGNFIYVFLGLFFLFRFLKPYLHEAIALSTVLILFFGTNLYHYALFEPGMSHSYLFFLYSAGLWATARWYAHPGKVLSALLGGIVGFIIVTRPTDILFALFPVFWIFSVREGRGKFLRHNVWNIAVALVSSSAIVCLQLAYWKYTSGSWIFYSYGDEGFAFRDPYILHGLFSYQKGWFVYTPLALLGFAGLFSMIRDRSMPFYSFPMAIYFMSAFYILFSWWLWYYGGSFGSRVLVQSYALLALPTAYLIGRIWQGSKTWFKVGLVTVVLGGVFLNLIQTYQYSKGIIHWSCMSKEAYWRVFLTLDHDPETDALLLNESEVLTRMRKRLEK